ncbi:hypothetical protein HHI36_014981 [Cryptolaemus montrouzieri]|uniref:Uncharacterized protein n=1 Tax=Cryptolaemus montrouzieri TaxID=559131 RepID=A0ABD2N4B2_9CUCU
MICGKICSLLFLVTIFELVTSAPSSEGATCFEQQCPPRTTGCKKITKTSEDKTTLDETIVCLDVQDYELQRFTKQLPNPYGPHTHYESTSFSGSYSFSGGMRPININHNNHIGNNKEVEEFK